MPTALLVLIFVSLLPYVLAALGGAAKVAELGHFDHHHPRIQSTQLMGKGARVMAAQSNAWEALAFYSAVLFTAYASGVHWDELAAPALLFGLTRAIHPLFYIANMAMARSLVVLIGLTSCLYMFGLAAV